MVSKPAVEDDVNSSDKNNNPKTGVRSSSDINLSFGDPFYLHPNDTSEIIINLDLSMDLVKKDSSNHGLAYQWDMCNSIVVTWILNSLSPELFAGAIYAKSASKIWNDLKETYDKQFDAMFSLPTCTCDAAKHFDQHNQLIKLTQGLMGLDESYLAIKSNLTKEALPSVKTAFSVISGEESHRNVTSVGTTKPAATAFVAKTFDNKKKFNNNYKGSGSNSNSNSNNNNKGPNPNLKCTNCNKTGHTVDRCFELIGYPAGYVKRNSNFNSRPVTSNNAFANVHSNGVSSNNATTGNSHVSLSLVNNVIVGNISLGWIVDSGANQHMTASANFLTNVVDVSNLGLNVGHPNGTQALITEIKDLKINNEVTLYDVLVVPGIPSSVLSGKYPYFYVYGHDLSLSHLRGNDDSSATSMDKTNNTHPEGTIPNETDFINDFYENLEFNFESEELLVHTLRRYKARLVVKGFNQKKGIEFDETFSPVVKMSTVRCVIALYVTNNWPLFQLDVNNAFLYRDLDEDIYMTIPKGFASKDNKNKVYPPSLSNFSYYSSPLVSLIMSEEDQTVDVATLPKFDMLSYGSIMTAKDVKSLVVRHGIPLDLHPVALTEEWTMDKLSDDMIGLYEQCFEFLWIRVPFSTFLLAVIKHFRIHISQLMPLGLNRLTMFELYCWSLDIVPSMNLFHVFYKVSKQGHWFTFEKRVGKGVDQVIPDKTDHQKEVEVEDPKIVAISERKARAAAKKREKKKRVANEGEDGDFYWSRGENPFGTAAATAESREDRSPPCDSANHSFHNDTDVRGDEGTNSLRLGSFVDQSGRNLNTIQTEVFQSSPGDHFVHPNPTDTRIDSLTRSVPRGNIEEGESSQSPAYYADMLERFENLQADYDKLAETHAECEEAVQKLVDARLALEHNSRLYLDMSEQFKKVKDEHASCTERLQMLEDRNIGWAKGLTEECSEEDLLELMSRMENFDAYANKKMYVEYDKLFEKRYPFAEKISRSFCHIVSDLLKVYPVSPTSEQASPSKPSSGKAPSSSAPKGP
nr:hypothetical protein [Tanacetum cinerariifolium]